MAATKWDNSYWMKINLLMIGMYVNKKPLLVHSFHSQHLWGFLSGPFINSAPGTVLILWITFMILPLSVPPPPRDPRPLSLPSGHTGSDSTPLGSRAYAGCRASRPTGRGRALTCFPQRYEGMTHGWRIVRERQTEIWIWLFESQCRADKPSKNLQYLPKPPGAGDIG